MTEEQKYATADEFVDEFVMTQTNLPGMRSGGGGRE